MALRVEGDSDVGRVAVDLGEGELGRRLPETEGFLHLLPDMSVGDDFGSGRTSP